MLSQPTSDPEPSEDTVDLQEEHPTDESELAVQWCVLHLETDTVIEPFGQDTLGFSSRAKALQFLRITASQSTDPAAFGLAKLTDA